jgi:2-polyprenyl-6-methoxyphenol hydroxylase-like FAD-dependent oxidoreductase
MRVLVVGGSPARLYFADLFKRSFPNHTVTVVEQNARGGTYGFGVVFAEVALAYLAEADRASYQRITAAPLTWRDLTLVHRDRRLSIDGNGFSGISRLERLRILERFCSDAGLEMRHGEIATIDSIKGADLVVGADGLNSVVQTAGASVFQPHHETLGNRFMWYGTSRVFETLTLTFLEDVDGHFVAHYYRYTPDMSTFIVECDAKTFQSAGFARMTDDQSRAYCERIFAPDLDDHVLISNKSKWRGFPATRVEEWIEGNKVLIGDALRSVFFLSAPEFGWLWRILSRYGEHFSNTPRMCLQPSMGSWQRDDQSSTNCLSRPRGVMAGTKRMQLAPVDLAYDYMTASGRVNEERLRRIAPRFMRIYDRDRGAGSLTD